MKYLCRLCPETFMMPKSLFDHWKEKHDKDLRCYLVKNRALKQSGIVLAPSIGEALARLSWKREDCFISGLRRPGYEKV